MAFNEMVGIRKHALKLENSPVGSHKSLPEKSNLHETKKMPKQWFSTKFWQYLQNSQKIQ